MEWDITGENNCGIGWERVENGMGHNRREQLWHWLGESRAWNGT